MNKLLKGSIAGAAGLALLLGGAGTLALWNDAADFSGVGLASGELNLNSNSDGAWASPAISLWVPEDSNTYTETFQLNAAGDNLAAELEVTTASAAVDGFTVVETVVVTDDNNANAVVSPNGLGVYDFTEGNYTVSVSVVVTFDAIGTADQNGTTTLDDVISVTLQQVI
jgi:alternate signal-mediated exported protein